MSIGIFYGSSTGTTQSIAEDIKMALDLKADLLDIGSVDVGLMNEYTHLILGTSTWGDGDLQDDWEGAFHAYKMVDFSRKTVAFFGTGDQEGYDENFLDAMGTLYKVALENGANIVGDGWPTDGYEYSESTAVNEKGFVGLAIDEDNQDHLSNERIKKWIEIIKPHFTQS